MPYKTHKGSPIKNKYYNYISYDENQNPQVIHAEKKNFVNYYEGERIRNFLKIIWHAEFGYFHTYLNIYILLLYIQFTLGSLSCTTVGILLIASGQNLGITLLAVGIIVVISIQLLMKWLLNYATEAIKEKEQVENTFVHHTMRENQ